MSPFVKSRAAIPPDLRVVGSRRYRPNAGGGSRYQSRPERRVLRRVARWAAGSGGRLPAVIIASTGRDARCLVVLALGNRPARPNLFQNTTDYLAKPLKTSVSLAVHAVKHDSEVIRGVRKDVPELRLSV